MSEFDFEGRKVSFEDGDSVLDALLSNGESIPNRCRAGICQSCLLKTNSGNVPEKGTLAIDASLKELGYFLGCQAPAVDGLQVSLPSENDVRTYEAEVERIHYAAEDVVVMNLHVAGFPGGGGRFLRLQHQSGTTRSYSIATPAWSSAEDVSLHIRLIPDGEMSSHIRRTTVGDRFLVQGPFGKCTYREESSSRPLLLIGSGTGLSPLYSIATHAGTDGHSGGVFLYVGAATAKRLYFTQELDELSSKFGVNVTLCSDDTNGSPLDLALQDHPNLEGYIVYLCGHPDLVKQAQRKTFLAGASMKDIYSDPFVAS